MEADLRKVGGEGSLLRERLKPADVLTTSIFLRLAGESPSLRTQSGLWRGLTRYLQCWLPLLSMIGEDAEQVAVPTDVAWFWFVHLSNPQRYFRDVTKLTSRFPEFGKANPLVSALRPRGGEAWTRTAAAWRANFPKEPFEVVVEEDELSTVYNSLRLPRNETAEFLLSQAESQLDFYYQVWLPQYQSDRFLEQAVDRYEKFLILCAKYPDHVLYPTFDIALVWRTHMSTGLEYVKDSIQIFGRLLIHPMEVQDIARGDLSDSLLAFTADKYWKEFGEKLGRAGTLGRGRRPKMGKIKSRWVGTLYLDHVTLQGLRLDGRSYRPYLAVSGMRGGGNAVRSKLEQDGRGGWALGRKMVVGVDGRAGADVTLEVALKQGKFSALTSRTPPRSFHTSLRLDSVSSAPASKKLSLRSVGSGREEATLDISYRVEKRPLRGSLAVIIKPSSIGGPLLTSVGPASADPFMPPSKMTEAFRRELFLTDDDHCGMGTLKIEHFFDGLSLQRRHAMISFHDLTGEITASARLIGRTELVDDPSLVWNRTDLCIAGNGKPSLVFLITVGGKDWGLVHGAWQGYVGRNGSTPGEPGALGLRVAKFLDNLDDRAETYGSVIASGKSPWKLFKSIRTNSGGEDFMTVTAQPVEGVVTVGCGIEPEAGTLLVSCASLLTLFLCPPPAIVAGNRPTSYSAALFGISGMQVGGLIGHYLATNNLDADTSDRIMEAVRQYFDT